MDAREAARLLWDCRASGEVVEELPDGLRPATEADGHAIQAELPGVSGRPVVGWKIAATSAAGQAHIHVDGPLPGRILDGTLLQRSAAVSLAGNRMGVTEPEFAFLFGADLAPVDGGRSRDEVLDAVASLHPSFEVPDSRFSDFTRAGAAQLLADAACAGPFVLGPAAPDGWRDADLAAAQVTATVSAADGEVRCVRAGFGRAALGDPVTALVWLVEELGRLGVTLERGQVVSTGTCMAPLDVLPGDTVHADYGPFGTNDLVLVR